MKKVWQKGLQKGLKIVLKKDLKRRFHNTITRKSIQIINRSHHLPLHHFPHYHRRRIRIFAVRKMIGLLMMTKMILLKSV